MIKEGEAAPDFEARDGWVVICVSDTGAGMSPEVRAKVFDPFFTTKGLSGMGLGLAVSYGVVSRHGGSIEVESEVGQGTTFRIRLPAVVTADEAVREARAARRNETRREKMAKILVVDDKKHVRQLLCEILEESGCETAQAASGREALARFDAERFDAVFTDIGMPGMSGWELARNLRERDARVPVAVITGWGETFSSSQKEAAQVDWLLSKPFAMAQITQIALEVSARRNASAPAAKELRDESEVEAACAC